MKKNFFFSIIGAASIAAKKTHEIGKSIVKSSDTAAKEGEEAISILKKKFKSAEKIFFRKIAEKINRDQK